MDDLFPYFERSVLAVQSYAKSFEEAYGKPAAARLKRFYHKRPLLSLYVGVFTILNIFPVCTLFVLSFFVLVISVLAALSVAVLITILFTLVGVVVVGVCVIVNFFTAIFIVTTGITIYAGIRLSTLLRAHGAPGIGKWLDECKAVVIGDDQHHQVEKAEDRSDVSDESIVVVDGRKKEQGETDSVKAEEPKQG